MVRSDNNQFKALFAGIIIGAVVGTGVYMIGRYLGMSSAASGGIIGGIVGAAGVALIRRRRSPRANSPINQALLAASLLGCAASSGHAQAFVSANSGVDAGNCILTRHAEASPIR